MEVDDIGRGDFEMRRKEDWPPTGDSAQTKMIHTPNIVVRRVTTCLSIAANNDWHPTSRSSSYDSLRNEKADGIPQHLHPIELLAQRDIMRGF